VTSVVVSRVSRDLLDPRASLVRMELQANVVPLGLPGNVARRVIQANVVPLGLRDPLGLPVQEELVEVVLPALRDRLVIRGLRDRLVIKVLLGKRALEATPVLTDSPVLQALQVLRELRAKLVLPALRGLPVLPALRGPWEKRVLPGLRVRVWALF